MQRLFLLASSSSVLFFPRLPFFADGCAALWDALAGAPAASMAEQLRGFLGSSEVEHRHRHTNTRSHKTHRHNCGVSDGGGNARRYSFRTPNKGDLPRSLSAHINQRTGEYCSAVAQSVVVAQALLQSTWLPTLPTYPANQLAPADLLTRRMQNDDLPQQRSGRAVHGWRGGGTCKSDARASDWPRQCAYRTTTLGGHGCGLRSTGC
jgi:hypothetical protein